MKNITKIHSIVFFERKWKVILLTFSLLLFYSCKKENQTDCLKSTGKIISEERTIPYYDGIDISDNINLYITAADNPTITVKAGKNLMDNIRTEVKDNTLYIENLNKCNWIRSYKPEMDIYVSTKNLSQLTYRGFGKVETVGSYSNTSGNRFFVDMWEASGNLKLDLQADSIYLKSHTGPANINCTGTSVFTILYMSGAGIIDASKLESKKALAIIRDVGDIHVHATEKLDAEIFSRGDIFYYGKPTQVNFVDMGDGNLIMKD